MDSTHVQIQIQCLSGLILEIEGTFSGRIFCAHNEEIHIYVHNTYIIYDTYITYAIY